MFFLSFGHGRCDIFEWGSDLFIFQRCLMILNKVGIFLVLEDWRKVQNHLLCFELANWIS